MLIQTVPVKLEKVVPGVTPSPMEARDGLSSANAISAGKTPGLTGFVRLIDSPTPSTPEFGPPRRSTGVKPARLVVVAALVDWKKLKTIEAGKAPVPSFVVPVADEWAASIGNLYINVVCVDAVLVENSRSARRAMTDMARASLANLDLWGGHEIFFLV